MKLPCIHEGELVPAREAVDAGLNPARKAFRCLHPQQPHGEIVCRCKQCKRCPMYQPEEADNGGITASS